MLSLEDKLLLHEYGEEDRTQTAVSMFMRRERAGSCETRNAFHRIYGIVCRMTDEQYRDAYRCSKQEIDRAIQTQALGNQFEEGTPDERNSDLGKE